MASSVPREVYGRWYPVPCPVALPVGTSFSSREACLAACETSDTYEASWDDTTYKLELEFEEWREASRDEVYGEGYRDGFDACKDAVTEAIEAV